MLDVRHAVSPAESAQFNAVPRGGAFVLTGLFGATEVRQT